MRGSGPFEVFVPEGGPFTPPALQEAARRLRPFSARLALPGSGTWAEAQFRWAEAGCGALQLRTSSGHAFLLRVAQLSMRRHPAAAARRLCVHSCSPASRQMLDEEHSHPQIGEGSTW